MMPDVPDRTSLERLVVVEEAIKDIRIDIREMRLELDTYRMLPRDVAGLKTDMQALAQKVDTSTATITGFDITMKSYAVQQTAREQRDEEARLRGQRARLDRESRTNRVANLILTALGGLLTAALISGFIYVNTTYKSYTLDLVGGVVLAVGAIVGIWLWRSPSPPVV
jgi:hypothetical protein